MPLGPNQWEPGHFSPLIERNTVVPASRSNAISPIEQHQREINLMIYQGESPFVRDNVRIGQLRVALPADIKADKTVEVRYTYDTSGILEVEATPVATQKTVRLVIEGTPGTMSRAEIDKRLKELAALKIHPRDEQENAAIIARLRAAYENSLGDQRQSIGHILAQFEAVLHTHDKRQIQDARAQIEEILSRVEGEDVF